MFKSQRLTTVRALKQGKKFFQPHDSHSCLIDIHVRHLPRPKSNGQLRGGSRLTILRRI